MGRRHQRQGTEVKGRQKFYPCRNELFQKRFFYQAEQPASRRSCFANNAFQAAFPGGSHGHYTSVTIQPIRGRVRTERGSDAGRRRPGAAGGGGGGIAWRTSRDGGKGQGSECRG